MWKDVHGDISKNSTFIILWQVAAASASGEHPQSVHQTGGGGPGVSEEGRKSNSAQPSQNLWRACDAAYGT